MSVCIGTNSYLLIIHIKHNFQIRFYETKSEEEAKCPHAFLYTHQYSNMTFMISNTVLCRRRPDWKFFFLNDLGGCYHLQTSRFLHSAPYWELVEGLNYQLLLKYVSQCRLRIVHSQKVNKKNWACLSVNRWAQGQKQIQIGSSILKKPIFCSLNRIQKFVSTPVPGGGSRRRRKSSRWTS